MRVIETSLEDDLAAISGYLWTEGIRHRVFEERGRQILDVPDPRQAERARELCAAWREGRLRLVKVPREPAGTPLSGAARVLGHVRRYPVLSGLVILAILVFPFSVAVGDGGVLNPVAKALLVVDPARLAPGADFASGQGGWQVWRWLTPIFLHFSIVHLAFNCVVVIELGRRVEAACGPLAMLLVVGLIGVVSNVTQLIVAASVLFGGLSGVGYGLLGFLLVMARRFPDEPVWRLPAGLAFGLLIFLVVFSTGVTEPFGLHVANAAHWGGLAAGALLAMVWRARSPAAVGWAEGQTERSDEQGR